jgi:hypothetical protein
MKHVLTLITIAALSFASITFAAETETPARGPGMMNQGQASQMQQHMKQMQEQMEKIRATRDPAERRKWMQEHMDSMNQGMMMMRGMGGPIMKGMMDGQSAMGGGRPGDMEPGMMGGDAQEMMGRRMDMMQMMMEQMMQHQQMMMDSAPPPAK